MLKIWDRILSWVKTSQANLIFQILSTALALLGLMKFQNNWLFLVIYMIPFGLMIILTGSTAVLRKQFEDGRKQLEKSREKNNEIYTRVINENFREVLNEYKKCLSELAKAYNAFAAAIPPAKADESSVTLSWDDTILEQLFEETIRANKRLFSSVVEALKNITEYKLNQFTRDNVCNKISVCIKQLGKFYTRENTSKSKEALADLQAFAVYRNKAAIDQGRETGRLYQVTANSPLATCVSGGKPASSCYIENDILRALEHESYKCENEAELRADKTYTATMVVPIRQPANYYYGFLCIDTVPTYEDIFRKEELLPTMQCFADLLAAYYHHVWTYIPSVFDYIYERKTNTRDDQGE